MSARKHVQSSASVQALLFLEEMASILLTPFILHFALPKCAPAIVRFVRDFTVRVDGLGDVCSLAAFDLKQHGNSKYGSPFQANKVCPLRNSFHVQKRPQLSDDTAESASTMYLNIPPFSQKSPDRSGDVLHPV